MVLGDYLQAMPPEYATEGEFIRLTEDDVNRRLPLYFLFVSTCLERISVLD